MAMKSFFQKCMGFVGQYRYVLLVILVGLVLMGLPTGTKKESAGTQADVVKTSQEEQLSDLLESILSEIDGAGEVSVLLSIDQGAETIYQLNEDITEGDSSATRTDTVLVTDVERTQNGLVRKIIPQTYLGALVVCEGGDNPAVKLAITDAVSKVTGLSSDRIVILKMK